MYYTTNLGNFCGEGNGNPVQYSCLENPTGRGAWWAVVHGVVKSQTRLSDFTFTFHFSLEKEMATHSSVLAWRIPGTEEPGGLPSVGSHRVRHDWSDLKAAACMSSLSCVILVDTLLYGEWECPNKHSSYKNNIYWWLSTSHCAGNFYPLPS